MYSAYVTQSPLSPVGSTFTFKGKFADANQKQAFRVYYSDNTFSDFEFKKIKSLYYSATSTANPPCNVIKPNQVQPIIFPLCQVTNATISFPNVKWITAFENPELCFGTVTDYEYQLPANWKIGTFTSTGTNWFSGTNSVVVTSDLGTGDGGVIRIRASNKTCGAGLAANGPITNVLISRPAPNLTFTATQTPICFGTTKAITLNNIPSGASVSWAVTYPNNSQLQIIGCSTCSTVTIQNSGTDNVIGTVTATVQDCSNTYVKTYNVTLGSPPYGIITPYLNYCLGGSDWELGLQASSPDPTVTQYLWSRDGVPAGSGSSWYTYEFPPSCMTIGLKVGNACGVSTEGTQVFCPPCSYRMAISPNPAKGQMNISLDNSLLAKEGKQNSNVIFKLVKAGNSQIIRQWSFTNNQKVYSINITGIRKGIYILEMSAGNEKESKQVVIEE